MFNIKNTKAFTLVELVIVIVILAILGTIAFFSFNSYSSSSRDSVRLTDISSLNKSLELFNINAAKYPDPTGTYMTVVYSGGAIFEQGLIGDTVVTTIGKINKKPIDPLSSKEYKYSVNMTNTSYQLKADLENKPTTGFHNIEDYEFNIKNIFKATYADANTGSTVCYIKGNFNGLVEKTNTGNTNYILAVPGLILTDSGVSGDNTLIEYSTLSGKVLCNGLNDPCIINYNPTLIYEGSGNTVLSSVEEVYDIMINLKTAYSGSNISNNNSLVSNLLTLTGTKLVNLGTNIVPIIGLGNSIGSLLGGNLITMGINCNDGVPLTGNKLYYNNNDTYSFTTEIGSSDLLSYSVSPNENTCEWKCKTGYTKVGSDCVHVWTAGDDLTVNIGGTDYTYTTKSAAGKARTSQNMKHLPTAGANTCYNNNSANCNSDYGRLYDFDAAKTVCGRLGSGWHLPSNGEWGGLAGAGANGWLGNKLLGIVSLLPGKHVSGGSFTQINIRGYRWSSDFSSSHPDSYFRSIVCNSAALETYLDSKWDKYSVICVK